MLNEISLLLIKKLPDVLVRNDRDVQRFKDEQKIEFMEIVTEFIENNVDWNV